MAPPIPSPAVLRDHAFVGDGLRGALVDAEGRLVWLCFPTFGDPALLAGLLGSGGTYQVGPTGRHVNGGSYRDGTLIWRNRWVTASGVAEVHTALALPAEPGRAVVLRRLVAVEGAARFHAALGLAADYGRVPLGPWKVDGGTWSCGDGALWARWSAPGEALAGARGSDVLDLELVLAEGGHLDLVLEVGRGPVTGGPPEPATAWRSTEAGWRRRVPDCRGVAAAEMRRSLAVLHGMTTPDGATVAAATTSLPERAEAGRNYDYRYAWIRDTCYVGQAGYSVPGGEALGDGATRWVTARLLADGDDTHPAYQLDGSPVPDARDLDVPGYPGGTEVVGNRVRTQRQLDLFGEALLLLSRAAAAGRLDDDGRRALGVAVDAVRRRWPDPEAGIWETHDHHWTHSRLVCVAGLRAAATVAPDGEQRRLARAVADVVWAEACRTGLHPGGRWRRAEDDDRIDASLLLAQLRGATAPDDPRATATRAAVAAELDEDGHLYRYAHPPRPLGEVEGAFVICNFWMALACTQAGELVAATRWFERGLASSGTAGIFSEEYDVAQRQLRGNLPQAFVHALAVESAAALDAAGAGRG